MNEPYEGPAGAPGLSGIPGLGDITLPTPEQMHDAAQRYQAQVEAFQTALEYSVVQMFMSVHDWSHELEDVQALMPQGSDPALRVAMAQIRQIQHALELLLQDTMLLPDEHGDEQDTGPVCYVDGYNLHWWGWADEDDHDPVMRDAGRRLSAYDTRRLERLGLSVERYKELTEQALARGVGICEVMTAEEAARLRAYTPVAQPLFGQRDTAGPAGTRGQ